MTDWNSCSKDMSSGSLAYFCIILGLKPLDCTSCSAAITLGFCCAFWKRAIALGLLINFCNMSPIPPPIP
eukprot:CAMPEP_0183351356 /NCGR_PEP_ID=MMETSP0164_2-20130417/24236_1 /TAXON_ID=221442 /ORGANISM="Coccolithus pelagicus ssp braarudi, Strain PLY182g" /LENGTH=69 /DNA_ID=CAMNT_0025523517 /DNA_START=105 /DNA_END=310 /DNA_ORIENTATION=-